MARKIQDEIYKGILHLKLLVKKHPEDQWDEVYRELAAPVLALATRAMEIQLKMDSRGRPAGKPYAGMTAEQRWFSDVEKLSRRKGVSKQQLEMMMMRGTALGIKVSEGAQGRTLEGVVPSTPEAELKPSVVTESKINPDLPGF